MTTGTRSRWLDMLTLFEAAGAVYCKGYDFLIQFGLEHDWIDPDTGALRPEYA